MKWMDGLLALLFPPKCIFCRRILKNGEQDLCSSCACEASLYPNRKFKPQFLDSFAAVWYYEGNVRRSLLDYKFHGRRHYVRAYGRFLARVIREEYPQGFDVLTWVPVSSLRRLTRGYDQAELLAMAVGRELDMEPVRCLRKIRHNRPQSRIYGYAQRKANALGAYRPENREAFRGKRVLILDDILTTGATAGECARMLLTAGAKEVHCAALAAARK